MKRLSRKSLRYGFNRFASNGFVVFSSDAGVKCESSKQNEKRTDKIKRMHIPDSKKNRYYFICLKTKRNKSMRSGKFS